jgi:hypothetical protein
MFLFVNYFSDMFRPQLLAVLRELLEDGQQLRPKHVGAIIK